MCSRRYETPKHREDRERKVPQRQKVEARFKTGAAVRIVRAFRAGGLGRGILSFIIGALAMIWAQFPLPGAFAIGILLGTRLFMVGLIMVTGGSALSASAR